MEIATLEQRKEDKQTMLAKIQQTSQQELYARNKVESEWDARCVEMPTKPTATSTTGVRTEASLAVPLLRLLLPPPLIP